MPSLKDIVDAMSASWPAALAIFVAAAAIMGADQFDVQYMDTLPSWSVGAAFLGSILSGSILVVALARAIGNLAMSPMRRRRLKAAQANHARKLEDLPEKECFILVWAVANNTQVISEPYFNNYIKALVAKGFLEIPPGNHHSDETPFYIPDHIWAVLKADIIGRESDIKELVGYLPFDGH